MEAVTSNAVPHTLLSPDRLAQAKAAYTTRHVPLLDLPVGLRAGALRPSPGDLVLARVEEVGHHTRLELGSGRRSTLFVGDEIVVAYAARYAPDQFEAEVPDDLGECDLVAAGGVAGRAISAHGRIHLPPTRLRPLGLLAVDGGVLNVRRFAAVDTTPVAAGQYGPGIRLAVVGTAMNSGKTTVTACLARGLTRAGHIVGAAKVTGTGAGGDRWQFQDAGAAVVADFTDAGYASTYRVPPTELIAAAQALTGHLALAGADAVVLEVADGLLQAETAGLLASPEFAALVDGIVFAAGDAMGALAGVTRLRALGLPVVAVSGILTASPLARREAADSAGVPVVESYELADPTVAAGLVAQHVRTEAAV